MKKSQKFICAAFFALLLMLLAPARAGALEISIAGGAGNAGFSSDGSLPRSIYPAFALGVSGETGDFLSAAMTIEQDAVFGRKIAASFSYNAGFIALEIGPVLGFLNGTSGNSIKNGLFQPGLRAGLSLFFFNRVTIEASTDICLQNRQNADDVLYPSDARLALGVAFSKVVLSLEINQKSASVSGSGGYSQTRTDYGLYTRLFDKSSPFGMNVNLIYRTLDYESDTAEALVSSLVIAAGVDFRIKMVDIFLNGEASVYTFDESGSNPFLFNAMAGVRIRTN